jgi:hypothetical protein
VVGWEETVVFRASGLDCVDFREGGPPIIPPSTSRMPGALVPNRVAISRAERGEIAFRSR